MDGDGNGNDPQNFNMWVQWWVQALKQKSRIA